MSILHVDNISFSQTTGKLSLVRTMDVCVHLLFCLFVCLGATSGDTQVLLLALHEEIIFGGALGAIWDTEIEPRLFACKANKCLTHCTISPALCMSTLTLVSPETFVLGVVLLVVCSFLLL